MAQGKAQASVRQLKLNDEGSFIDKAQNGGVVSDATDEERKSAIERYARQKIQEHGKKEALRVVEAKAKRITAELPNPFWKVSIAIKGLPERKGLIDSFVDWLLRIFSRR